mmetsp:Transcript_52263/g.154262  ORF Transcript_52263/g.154262 Transcript_52263/m.154262 type:complete len:346 (-) Transcript_52263:4403-5440(-)
MGVQHRACKCEADIHPPIARCGMRMRSTGAAAQRHARAQRNAEESCDTQRGAAGRSDEVGRAREHEQRKPRVRARGRMLSARSGSCRRTSSGHAGSSGRRAAEAADAGQEGPRAREAAAPCRTGGQQAAEGEAAGRQRERRKSGRRRKGRELDGGKLRLLGGRHGADGAVAAAAAGAGWEGTIGDGLEDRRLQQDLKDGLRHARAALRASEHVRNAIPHVVPSHVGGGEPNTNTYSHLHLSGRPRRLSAAVALPCDIGNVTDIQLSRSRSTCVTAVHFEGVQLDGLLDGRLVRQMSRESRDNFLDHSLEHVLTALRLPIHCDEVRNGRMQQRFAVGHWNIAKRRR